jgi:hypothetical protein
MYRLQKILEQCYQATRTRNPKNGQAGELTPHCDGLKEKRNCTEMDGRHKIDSFDDLESKFRNLLSLRGQDIDEWLLRTI